MTERKRLTAIELLGERKTVRYKRANLTVETWVAALWGDVQFALAAHEQEGASDDDVAWAFVKEQVVDHTPSFNWDDAELDVLLPRITAAMTHPVLKARTPGDLVPELKAIRAEEKERWDKANQHFREQIPKLSQTVLRNVPRLSALGISDEVRQTLLKGQRMRSASIIRSTGLAKTVEASTPTWYFKDLRLDWAKINATILREVRLSDIGIDPSIYAQLSKLHEGKQVPTHGDLLPNNLDLIIKEVTGVARRAGARDLAEVVSNAAEQSKKSVEGVDLTALFEQLEDLSEEVRETVAQNEELAAKNGKLADEVNELSSKNSITRAVLASLAAGIILLIIQYVLAAKYGITPFPPGKPSP